MKSLFLQWLLRSFDKTTVAAALALLVMWLVGSAAEQVWLMLAGLSVVGLLGSLWTRRLIARESDSH
jgi:mannose/fructose/N-acetylgalactosamine-specific phosphotransferase system component IID